MDTTPRPKLQKIILWTEKLNIHVACYDILNHILDNKHLDGVSVLG